jgi:disulfide bond formation protein DsbB
MRSRICAFSDVASRIATCPGSILNFARIDDRLINGQRVNTLLARLTPRLGYALGCLICAVLIASALYLQYYEDQNPCPLCILQRIAFIGLGGVFLAGAVHGPGRTGAWIYSSLLTIIALLGISVAVRHVWLQHLPKDRVPECGPGLEYMLNRFPLGQALEKIFRGSGECAEAGWRFLTLTIAEWSLLWLVLLGVLAVVIALVASKRLAAA